MGILGILKGKIKLILTIVALIAVITLIAKYLNSKDIVFEDFIKHIWENNVEDWGYVILFFWSIMEGEWGLLLAGIASHQGYLNVYLCIFIAGLGGFAGDQIYFYIGRFNKNYVQKNFKSQRRKFAMAGVLMSKYGWSIIFVQRYLYGLRTIIPISIGLTRYSAVKFAIINLISAWVWAAVTIVPAWYFGEAILSFLQNLVAKIKQYPLIFVTILIIILAIIAIYFKMRNKNSKGVQHKKSH